ncbi:MAG: GntR family transcriptional regulator, partial [Bacilli bacterium]|nr:GntR family transcriptional regulator [Bacilli bacterium]
VQLVQLMQIHFTGTKPIFEEIVDQIKLYIEMGILKPQEKLPSVRELALSLTINPNTVMRAFLALTDMGYLVTLPKKGIYVAEEKSWRKEKVELPSYVEEALINLLASGVSIDQIETAIEKLKKEKKQ